MKRSNVFSHSTWLYKPLGLVAMLSFSLVSAKAEIPDTTGLVAHWDANGNAIDTAGGHDGTLVGNATYSSGIDAQAFDFTPASRILVADTNSFKTPSFTLSGWIFTRGWGGVVLYRGDTQPGADTYSISLGTPGQMTFAISDASNNGQWLNAPLELNKWTHFAATFEDATGAMKLYINGELKTNMITAIKPVMDLSNGANVVLGNADVLNDFSFNGKLDEVAIFSRAMTESQIREVYETQFPLETFVVAKWKAETNAIDIVGSHNGTVTGNVTYGEGVDGKAFDFRSVSRILVTDDAAFQTPSFTLSGWIYPRGWGGVVVYRGDSRPGADTYSLSLGTAGQMTFAISDASNNGQWLNAQLELNEWAHFAATFDDATGAMKLYINGELRTNIVTSIRPVMELLSGANIVLGNADVFNDFSFDGKLDEMAIYSMALSGTQVQKLYEAQNPSAPRLISLWKAEGNAVDSISGHNGALQGTVNYATGVVGQAFNIVPSGAGSRVRIEDHPDFATPSFTISGWVNPRVQAGHMLVRGDSRGGLDTYILSLYEAGKLRFYIVNSNNVSESVTGPLKLNRWTHFAASFDSITGDLKLFIDGKLAGATNTTLRPLIDLDPSLSPGIGLGNVADSSNFNMDGMLDEIGIYGRALDAQQIFAMFDVADTDKDGLIDVNETSVYHTDPTKKDTDGDGLGDKSELEVYNTNPLSGDTDSDGYSDFAEIYAGKKPNDASEFPAALLQSFTAVELEFIAKAGTTFYIQSSSNLVDWVNFDGPIVGDGNVWKKVYSARGSQKTYFRVEKAQ